MSSKKAVIVGYDAVSPLGTEMATQWAKAIRGESGLGALTRFPLTDDFPVNIAGEVEDIDTADYPFLSSRKLALWPSPIFKYAMLVVHRALVPADPGPGSFIMSDQHGCIEVETEYYVTISLGYPELVECAHRLPLVGTNYDFPVRLLFSDFFYGFFHQLVPILRVICYGFVHQFIGY